MIRAVHAADAQALADLYNYYIVHSLATFEEQQVSAADLQARMTAVAGLGLPWLVAEQGTEQGAMLVGYAYANRWRERSAYRYSAEVTVYLAPEHLGEGWGRRLYSALFADLRAAGVHAVLAGITLPNPASVALHEKMGMRKVAHFEEVGFKQGQWLDVGYWQMQLEGSRERDAE
jgi:phosphinothricin acetyltransferase